MNFKEDAGSSIPTLLTFFLYSEKATKFCKISIVYLTVTAWDKSTVEISKNFVAISEYINFNTGLTSILFFNYFRTWTESWQIKSKIAIVTSNPNSGEYSIAI